MKPQMTSLAFFLHSSSYFKALNNEEIGRIKEEVVELSYAKGEVVFTDGESCRGLYMVKAGRIQVFKCASNGKKQILFIVSAGETFNDVAVFDCGPNIASASALEPTTVYVIPREALLSLVAESPVAQAIIRTFAARLRHLTQVVADLSFRSVISRLARMLLDESGGATLGPYLIPRLTQSDMATRVGSVREVVARALKVLEKKDAIRIERQRILVIDQEKLRAIV